jgi:3,4-dihydroxy 2-butanone 4-phosphate synthase/GTP cyclohydrolase II
MHRKNLLGDVFGDLESSRDGPTGDTLRAAMKMIGAAGRGAIVYLRGEQAGDGIDSRLTHVRRGVFNSGADAPDLTNPNGLAGSMPHRELGIGSQILRNLGIHRLRLITDHAKVWPGIEAFGLEIAEHVAVRRE